MRSKHGPETGKDGVWSRNQMDDYFSDLVRKALELPPTEIVHVSTAFFATVKESDLELQAYGDSWLVTWKRGPVFRGCYRVAAPRQPSGPDDLVLGGEDYIGEILTDPTWEDLTIEAERMIRAIRDTHHCYLEAADVVASDLELLGAAQGEGVLLIRLCMGS
ncbi:hypothetical protein CMI37_16400 [Candidatus Pacearchaeota archaeon]|nr:hypothetical protein [Candidatus Pacearchaeota archaeon]|tara:strand:- start:260 stop:745 length:486 start_codon:yes stop_codon:yes gene_type:complete